MANLSDVYNIEFKASSKELAEALFGYVQECENIRPYYELTQGAELDGLTINGNGANGRWVYIINLEGYFMTESWFGEEDYKKVLPSWLKVEQLLKDGGKVEINYSEDEPGCEVWQDGEGLLSWNAEENKLSLAVDCYDHDRPDCDIEREADGTYFCYDHDCKVTNIKDDFVGRYCQEVEEVE